MNKFARLDHKYVWHPFTQMRDWLRREPIVIVSGRGTKLRDAHGREYLDANSSIWTNLHGHAHPKINAAIRGQLGKIAHSSALGFANEPASLLAERLVKAANPRSVFRNPQSKIRNPQLAKAFFSDDGSTALEVALKLAYVFARRSGRSRNPRFLSLEGAYHGDTVGAVGLGHIDLFHKAYSGLLFKTDRVMAPYCYRCPFNRAKPERADARDYRKCGHECIGLVEKKFTAAKRAGNPYAAFVVEPLMQGAAGMIPQPAGWLRRVAEIARGHNAQLIADEVMTAFGRTGGDSLFASHQEGVQPDYLAFAKGLTGGYLPMAATLTTPAVFDAFLGDYAEFKTFFHGHSFTGNQLGASAALASLDLLQSPASVRSRKKLQAVLRESLQTLWTLPKVGDIRQVGLVAGVELVRDWRTREPFDLREQAGIRVCEGMARRGVLTRPVGNVIVLMPPYCATAGQVRRIVKALGEAIAETFGGSTV
jgi:adenosylmethionine-8-amino-7-oxononanoate aminotransferase